MTKALNRVFTILYIMALCTILLIWLNCCGRIDTPMPDETNKTYTINKYNNGVLVGGWKSKTKVYLKFEDKFIEVLGDYTIQENINE